MVEKVEWFEAEDGKRFPTQADAERHDELRHAREAYVRARADYTKAIAEIQKTADGYQFELRGLATYYSVVEPIYSIPRLEQHSFYFWHVDLDEGDHAFIWTERPSDPNSRRYRVRISDLYRDRANADKALLAAQKEWLANRQEEINQLEEKIDAQN